MYKISVIYSLEEFYDLSDEWNDLLSRSVANCVFLTWEWMYTWAEVFLRNRRLFIVCLHENERLVAIAPWCVCQTGRLSPTRRIAFLGTPEMGSDYLDVFAEKGKEKEAFQLLYAFLFKDAKSSWNSMTLADIPAESLFFLHLTEELKRDGKYYSVGNSAYCPVVRLPKSWEEYLECLSTHRRKSLRRDMRALQKYRSFRYDSVSVSEEPYCLERFFSLYRSLGIRQDPLFYSHLKQFAKRCAAKPWVEVDFLTVDGQDVAALLHFMYKDTLFLYTMAVNKGFNSKLSTGNLLVAMCLEQAVARGIGVYDFLKGTEDYKFYWAQMGNRSLVLSVYRMHLSSVGRLATSMAKDLGRVVMR